MEEQLESEPEGLEEEGAELESPKLRSLRLEVTNLVSRAEEYLVRWTPRRFRGLDAPGFVSDWPICDLLDRTQRNGIFRIFPGASARGEDRLLSFSRCCSGAPRTRND